MHAGLRLIKFATVTPAYFSFRFLDNCLGPGFSRAIPPQGELSRYSTTVLQPGDVEIYYSLNFRCSGRLESLTIPSQVRGSVHPRADNLLEPRPSIWRLKNGYYVRDFESDAKIFTAYPILEVANGEFRSFNFTIMLQRNIQAEDVLGFRVVNSRQLDGNTVIEHLPLLYKPGPIPGDFTPVIIANFVPTTELTTASNIDVSSDEATSPSNDASPNEPITAFSTSPSEPNRSVPVEGELGGNYNLVAVLSE